MYTPEFPQNTIRIVNGLAYIGNTGPLNTKSLQLRIKNIQEQRHQYATEEAWLRVLTDSQDALSMLEAAK